MGNLLIYRRVLEKNLRIQIPWWDRAEAVVGAQHDIPKAFNAPSSKWVWVRNRGFLQWGTPNGWFIREHHGTPDGSHDNPVEDDYFGGSMWSSQVFFGPLLWISSIHLQCSTPSMFNRSSAYMFDCLTCHTSIVNVLFEPSNPIP